MSGRPSRLEQVIPDASLAVKWYASHEPGSAHAQLFLDALEAGTLRLTAPEQRKVEVVRALRLGVRGKRYSVEDGWVTAQDLLALPIAYVSNDNLLEDAFRLASRYAVALYDALYLALAEALDVPLVTADGRFFRLAQQRQIRSVVWFEDLSHATTSTTHQ
jgi:predicted nucleic acid-binding protein